MCKSYLQLKVELNKDALPIEPPIPEVMVHSPVPVEGLLPASVTAVNPQVLMSNLSDALATVGIPLNENEHIVY
jgi:hypothetical protein